MCAQRDHGKKNTSEIKSICHDNVIYTDKKEIAEKLNDFFVNSIEEISKSIGLPLSDDGATTNGPQTFFKFKKIEIEDIKSSIKKIKSKSDPEWLKPDILMDSLTIIGIELCEIFNDSLRMGIFPEWKCSVITPVEKIAGTVAPEEFRPINLAKHR